jgi:uncharacterized repeat protein (TIGR04076 family)
MTRCKITVLRKEYYKDLIDEYINYENWGPCPVLNVGDVFYTGGQFGTDRPEGFCANAWNAIEKPCMVLASKGKIFGIDNKHIVCCNDGVRPVIFRIEAVDDGEPDRLGPMTR